MDTHWESALGGYKQGSGGYAGGDVTAATSDVSSKQKQRASEPLTPFANSRIGNQHPQEESNL